MNATRWATPNAGLVRDSDQEATPDDLVDDTVDRAVSIRTMIEADTDAIIAMDAKETGQVRKAYYEAKIARCIREPGLNTSLVAEVDGLPVGFLIGRLFFGEFGIPAARAVLDTLGVHPGFRGRHVGRALLDQYRKNMEALRIEAIDTLVEWDRFGLLAFFRAMGFRPSRDVDLVWDLRRYPFAAHKGACEVRPAAAADLMALSAMDRDLMGEGRSQYLLAKLDAVHSQPERHCFLVGVIQGELAGYLVASLYHGEFGIAVTRGVVDTLAVRERYQHQGVASGMLQSLRDWLEGQGVEQVETLSRWNDWELLRYFEYVGFRPSARLNLEWRLS